MPTCMPSEYAFGGLLCCIGCNFPNVPSPLDNCFALSLGPHVVSSICPLSVYTHLGRLACVLMSLLGVIYAALLTASLRFAQAKENVKIRSILFRFYAQSPFSLRIIAASTDSNVACVKTSQD